MNKAKNKKVKSKPVYNLNTMTFDNHRKETKVNRQNISYLIFDDNINDKEETILGFSRKHFDKSKQKSYFVANDFVY